MMYLLQLNEVKLSYYDVAIHLLSGFWSVFRAETSQCSVVAVQCSGSVVAVQCSGSVVAVQCSGSVVAV